MICHLLALLETRHFLHVSRIRVKSLCVIHHNKFVLKQTTVSLLQQIKQQPLANTHCLTPYITAFQHNITASFPILCFATCSYIFDAERVGHM
jgi:hypothetical protein